MRGLGPTVAAAALAAACLFLSPQGAQAAKRHHGSHHHFRHVARSMPYQFASAAFDESGMLFGSSAERRRYSGGYGPRPRAWCGYWMRQHVGADPGPSYNLARNWMHWGHGGPAGVGAIVVWPHHVGRIVGGSPGHWLIESGNDGHQVRTRERSIGGAIAIRWG